MRAVRYAAASAPFSLQTARVDFLPPKGFHVIVIDLVLPDVDGVDALAQLH